MESSLPNTPGTPNKRRKVASRTPKTPQKQSQYEEQYYMQYFEFSSEEGEGKNKKTFYKCKICSLPKNGTKRDNLRAHLAHLHSEFIVDAKSKSLKVKRLELLQNLVEIVAVNGRPFTYIHDSGFQAVIREDLAKLKAGGFGLSLSNANFPEVKNHLHQMASKVRDKMKDEVRGRALSLLADIVTKNDRSIFGFSMQFIIDGEHKVRSIGMIELKQRHTAVYLADVLCTRLALYEISLQQIFTMTTDNAANVQKMIRDVDTILKKKVSVAENLALRHLPQSTQTDHEISELLAEECEEDKTDEESIMDVLKDAIPEMYENLLSRMCEQVTERAPNVLWTVESVRCAAHKAQLAIKGAINKLGRNHRNVIALTRRVAKVLRTERVRNEMRAIDLQYNVPRMDIETRWGYLHLMVRY